MTPHDVFVNQAMAVFSVIVLLGYFLAMRRTK